ncbi:MAG: alkaline phosphatase D family protein, partial [Candidatus Latescibacteria bacterium]|nr:alkaline phosphatase D family protein [Candidatus Latescibacterota bacterium]
GNDHIIKAAIGDLLPNTQYHYRLIYGLNQSKTKRGPAGTFRTLPLNAKTRKPVRLTIISGMNYDAFYNGINAYEGKDKNLGYPALQTIYEQNPHFLICVGNSIFYDDPKMNAAKTVSQMRRKWHEQFAQPRLKNLLHQVPTYWQKNDRDHRYGASDTTTTDRQPTHKAGASVFKEQVPIVDPHKRAALTYRTHRLNKLVQIWLVENRDYRNPNLDPNTENKTLWGQEQRDWLKQTLQKSDAVFKLLISPTPMVGPDNAHKRDNHTNPNGFRAEGDHFITWLRRNDYHKKNFYIICGDRSWQYHSEHLTHIEEFCTGTLVDAYAKMAIKPGNPKGTDPSALITQRYASNEPTGGFLTVDIKPGKPATAAFIFYDEKGKELYRVAKEGKE